MEDTPFTVLRRFARPRAVPAVPEIAPERCELCSAALPATHRHLLEMSGRKVVCACDPCALRFQDVVGGRFKLIPRDARPLPGFRLSDGQWENLALPIGLAFFFYSTPDQKMTALYPGPAGAAESLLPLAAWGEIVSDNPLLHGMQADVEALLVNRVGTARKYFIVPIDRCYELAGLIRLHWRGLSGGDVVWQEIDRFFSRLETQSQAWERGNA
jgi:Family of unknown function (DUF5947)